LMKKLFKSWLKSLIQKIFGAASLYQMNF
jgi:hypothetical protein